APLLHAGGVLQLLDDHREITGEMVGDIEDPEACFGRRLFQGKETGIKRLRPAPTDTEGRAMRAVEGLDCAARLHQFLAWRAFSVRATSSSAAGRMRSTISATPAALGCMPSA